METSKRVVIRKKLDAAMDYIHSAAEDMKNDNQDEKAKLAMTATTTLRYIWKIL